MKALDLFCGAGGVSEGLRRAGFEVTGVDINPQPHYRGGVFVQADALSFPLEGYDLIWASPPCQAYSVLRRVQGEKRYPELVEPVRERLLAAGVAWVIENVVGAPLRDPIVLCGGSSAWVLEKGRCAATACSKRPYRWSLRGVAAGRERSSVSTEAATAARPIAGMEGEAGTREQDRRKPKRWGSTG